MKSLRLASLVICLGLPLWACSAQQPAPAQPPIASAAPSPQNITETIRKSALFLEVYYQDGTDRKGIVGTCFFVSFEDKRLPDGQVFLYLVTNRHVAQPGIDLNSPYPVSGAFIRANLLHPEGEVQSVKEPLPLSTNHWHFPQDPSVDLAILPYGLAIEKYSYSQIPSSIIVTSDMVKAGDVADGDRITFAGYFTNFPGLKRMEPILRSGVIAMMPEEVLDTTLHKPGHVYLADLHAFHGNSGSPVFVNVGGVSHHGVTMMGEKYFLLGLISGYYPEAEGFSVPAATVLTGQVHDNSGIAAIVPADEINELLNSREVQSERDRIVAIEKKKP